MIVCVTVTLVNHILGTMPERCPQCKQAMERNR